MVAAGCLGESTGGSPAPSSQTPETRVEITYFGAVHRSCATRAPCGVTFPLRSATCPAASRCIRPAPKARLIRCPGGIRPGEHCYAVPLKTYATSLANAPRRAWLILQQRELSCTPPRGGYSDPAAACRALAGYARLAQRPNRTECSCPPQIWQSRAVGTYRGRPLTLDLSPCATCGLGASGADLGILLPQLPTG